MVKRVPQVETSPPPLRRASLRFAPDSLRFAPCVPCTNPWTELVTSWSAMAMVKEHFFAREECVFVFVCFCVLVFCLFCFETSGVLFTSDVLFTSGVVKCSVYIFSLKAF